MQFSYSNKQLKIEDEINIEADNIFFSPNIKLLDIFFSG